MRHLEREFGGRTRCFTASFKASFEIAQEVADPLRIAREAGLEAMMYARGIPYNPSIEFDTETVCKVLWIGLKHSPDRDDRMDLESVQEAAFDMGWLGAKNLASEYLGIITTPRPSEVPEASGGSGETSGN